MIWNKVSPIDYNINNPYLNEPGYAPVQKEFHVANLQIKGEIPKDLQGQYIRNGPNPRFKPTGPYHWFDGDGMLHGTLIENGTATYTNKYIRTIRYQEEEEIGGAYHGKIGDLMTPEGFITMLWRKMLSKFGFSKLLGRGTANTSLTYHDRRVLALVEADVPYHILSPSLETIGRYDYEGKLKSSFTAHPKIDPQTKELIFFGYQFEKPYCRHHLVNAQGKLVRSIEINIPNPVMMHDMAITKNYSIILDLPLVFSREGIITGEGVLVFDEKRGSRFGILPRHAKDDTSIRWFTGPSGFMFHVLNAWEIENEIDEGKKKTKVVLIGCRSYKIDTNFFKYEPVGTSSKIYDPFLYRWEFDLDDDSNSIKEFVLDDDNPVEFPQIPENLVGHYSKYGYATRVYHEKGYLPTFDAVIKYEISPAGDRAQVVGILEYGGKKRGGECSFVPKGGDYSSPLYQEEDDGYLMTYVFDQATTQSELWIIDAKKMTPIAQVEMPQHIPYGFHGKWLSSSDIKNQIVKSSE